MTDEMKLEKAKKVFSTVCEALDDHDWHYEKDDDGLLITCGARGEDLPIDIAIKISVGRQSVLLLSRMPFTVPDEHRLDFAVAVSVVNNRLVDGCFDYDVKNGHIAFRMTSSFIESTLSKEVFSYMLFCSCQTIDDFNDKFFMLAKGMMSLEKFLSDDE